LNLYGVHSSHRVYSIREQRFKRRQNACNGVVARSDIHMRIRAILQFRLARCIGACLQLHEQMSVHRRHYHVHSSSPRALCAHLPPAGEATIARCILRSATMPCAGGQGRARVLYSCGRMVMSAVLRIVRTIGYKLGVSLLTILGASLVTHYLSSVSEFGIYSTIKNTLLFGSFYFIAFTRFFNYGMNRLKLDRQSTVGVAARFFMQISLALVPLTLIAVSLSGLSSFFVYATFVFGTLFFVLLFGFCANLLQAMNEIDWLNRVNVIQIASFSVLIAIFYILARTHRFHVTDELIWTLSLWLFSNILAALFTLLLTRRLAHVSIRPRRNDEIARGMFAYGKKVALQNVLTQVNYRGDAYMVILLAGTTAAGLYSPAVTSSEVLWQISTSVALIVYTRVAAHETARSIELTERTFRFTFWFLIVTAAAMYLLFSPLIHFIYGIRYAGSVPAFQVLLIGTTAYGMIGLLTQFFTDQMGKVTYPVYMQMTSIAVNLILCLLLIPHIGMLGGAIGSTAGYTVALIMSIVYFRRLTGRPLRHLFFFTADDRQLLMRLRPRARSVNEGGK